MSNSSGICILIGSWLWSVREDTEIHDLNQHLFYLLYYETRRLHGRMNWIIWDERGTKKCLSPTHARVMLINSSFTFHYIFTEFKIFTIVMLGVLSLHIVPFWKCLCFFLLQLKMAKRREGCYRFGSGNWGTNITVTISKIHFHWLPNRFKPLFGRSHWKIRQFDLLQNSWFS